MNIIIILFLILFGSVIFIGLPTLVLILLWDLNRLRVNIYLDDNVYKTIKVKRDSKDIRTKDKGQEKLYLINPDSIYYKIERFGKSQHIDFTIDSPKSLIKKFNKEEVDYRYTPENLSNKANAYTVGKLLTIATKGAMLILLLAGAGAGAIVTLVITKIWK